MEEKTLNEIFSNNLNYWLKERGKTQADMAKCIDVSSATASDWCNQKKIPRADKLVAISRWLMVELSQLMTEKKNQEPSDFDRLLYRLKDDKDFYESVLKLFGFGQANYEKAKDYITLLNNNTKAED